LEDEELKPSFQVFAPVIASTGYDITKYTEGYFPAIMHVLMYSTGLVTFSEVQSAEGRLDTICIGYKAICIFEFKLDETATAALTQIKSKHYATPFLSQAKTLYLVGVNFVWQKRKSTKYWSKNGMARSFCAWRAISRPRRGGRWAMPKCLEKNHFFYDRQSTGLGQFKQQPPP